MLENEALVRIALTMVDWSSQEARHNPEAAVTAAAMRARKALDERSLPMEALSATVIPCEILGVTFEDSSRRYLVEFRGLAQGSKVETARTDRADDARRGKTVETLVGRVLTTGARCLIYKVLQQVSQDKQVRVIVWAERLG